MDAVTSVGSETEQLVALVDDDDRFDIPYSELLPRQVTAINERFQDRVGKIKLLQNRAETGGVSEVKSMADVVPLLFAHTAYKSYPESWLMNEKWDRLGKWLDTVSTYRVNPMDTGNVNGLDEWLQLLVENDHYVACSSGTTGKCAMMNAAMSDLEFGGKALLRDIVWTGLAPNHDRKMISMGQTAATPKNMATGRPMMEAFSRPGEMPFAPDVPPITIGGIAEMVMLRKKIGDGTAQPSEIAHYDQVAAERAAAMESSVDQAVEALIGNRHDRLHLMGLYGPLYQVAEKVRARGFDKKDFQANSLFIAGGLKRAQLPDNYREFINDTFNLAQERICHAYGMQELNSNAPRCSAGRYHLAPWVMLMLLDESGETLIPIPESGEIEGRAAFFDLSLDGRWGGVISGDKIRARWDPCECGNRSPSVHLDIQRYADMASGDKIACSGTIDAYVRGVS